MNICAASGCLVDQSTFTHYPFIKENIWFRLRSVRKTSGLTSQCHMNIHMEMASQILHADGVDEELIKYKYTWNTHTFFRPADLSRRISSCSWYSFSLRLLKWRKHFSWFRSIVPKLTQKLEGNNSRTQKIVTHLPVLRKSQDDNCSQFEFFSI